MRPTKLESLIDDLGYAWEELEEVLVEVGEKYQFNDDEIDRIGQSLRKLQSLIDRLEWKVN